MKTKILWLALFAALLPGCSTSSGPMLYAKMDDAIDRYNGALRFGEFEKAQDMQQPAKRKRLDLAWLKNIHISSVDIVRRKPPPLSGGVYELTAQIHYFIESEAIEKTITDHQVWRYDENTDAIMLETEMPDFR